MKRIATLATALALAGLALFPAAGNASDFNFISRLGVVGAQAVVGFTCYTATGTAVYRADYLQNDEYYTDRQYVQFRTRYERVIGNQWVPMGLLLNWQSAEIGGYYRAPIPAGSGTVRLFTQYAYWNFSQQAWTLTDWFPEVFNKIGPTFQMWSNHCNA